MFKDYKEIFKDLRKLQDKLWQESMASFPGAALSRDIDRLQRDTLDQVNRLLGQAITQSLDLQREWVEQWAERAGGKDIRPKDFAELSTEAQRSTQRWLENQNLLWDQWLNLVTGGSSRARLPDVAEWEKAVQESIQAQMALLTDWAEMTDFRKLSGKEFTKLSNHIARAMDESLSTQQRLWDHWFDQLQGAGEPESHVAAPVPTEQEPAAAKQAPAPGEKKAKTQGKTRKAHAKPTRDGDDLKQINGIGPGLEKKLKQSGIRTLKALAALDDQDIARLEDEVIQFSGRIKRDRWVEQAKKLIS